ncbi:uncharacterized protein BJ212DRAFT_1331933 [Suillus subaureus]|uniref:Uncharacterized protein n=1 Tax=Suillus subaureus TaxID=48587 RepID=A0A9P7JGV1_9AGAM|nr:uncharacterized protein BJ212DRAFT_1331933 [Suillus subaureus]KAG1821546.1 hypothetical protein BJ212DRAFT_1331933 [Suillus subaureus]
MNGTTFRLALVNANMKRCHLRLGLFITHHFGCPEYPPSFSNSQVKFHRPPWPSHQSPLFRHFRCPRPSPVISEGMFLAHGCQACRRVAVAPFPPPNSSYIIPPIMIMPDMPSRSYSASIYPASTASPRPAGMEDCSTARVLSESSSYLENSRYKMNIPLATAAGQPYRIREWQLERH